MLIGIATVNLGVLALTRSQPWLMCTCDCAGCTL